MAAVRERRMAVPPVRDSRDKIFLGIRRWDRAQPSGYRPRDSLIPAFWPGPCADMRARGARIAQQYHLRLSVRLHKGEARRHSQDTRGLRAESMTRLSAIIRGRNHCVSAQTFRRKLAPAARRTPRRERSGHTRPRARQNPPTCNPRRWCR